MYQVDATNLYTNEYREKEKKFNANFFELDLQFIFSRKDQVKMEVLKWPSLDCALLFLKILKNAKDLIFMLNFIQGKKANIHTRTSRLNNNKDFPKLGYIIELSYFVISKISYILL